MIIIPWWIRLGIDCSLFFVPYWTLCNYPRTIFTPLGEIRRKRRRRGFDEIKIRDDKIFDVQTVINFKKQLGLQD